MIIEAATENLELKLKIFAQLDKVASAATLLATNTSSISITRIAAATQRPDKVIGMHFFNPVPMMSLVELIRGIQTAETTYREVGSADAGDRENPVQVRNSPGFVVNRLLSPMLNEAMFVLGEGFDGGGNRRGDEARRQPSDRALALADMIGLDVQLAVMQVLFDGFRTRYRPAPLLVEMVEAGLLGRKTGRDSSRTDTAVCPAARNGIARQESRGPRHDSTPITTSTARLSHVTTTNGPLSTKARHRRAGRGLGQIRGQGVSGEFAQVRRRWKPRWPLRKEELRT